MIFYTAFFLNKSNKYTSSIFFCIIFILLAGFKYRVGTDALLYQDLYETYPKIDKLDLSYINNSRWGWLFISIYSISHTFFHSFIFYQFFHAIIVTLSVYLICEKFTQYILPALTLYFIAFYLYLTFDLYREGLAVSIYLLSFHYLIKKKYVIFYICCCCCFFIHASSFIIFFSPLFISLKLTKRCWIGVVITLLLSLIITKYLSLISSYIPINSIKVLVTPYINRIDKTEGLTLMRVLYTLFIFYIAIYKNIGRINKRELPIINMAYISILLISLNKGIPFIFRLNNYFNIFSFIAVALFLERNILNATNKNFIKYITIILMVCSPQIMDYIYNQKTYNAYIPYVSILNPTKIYAREWHSATDYQYYDK